MRYQIKNNRTGEMRVVDATQLPQYGLQAPAEKKGFVKSAIEDFFFPATTETTKIISGATKARRGVPKLEQQQRQIEQQSRQLTAKARKTTDPVEKKRLLEQSKRVSQGLEQIGLQAGELERGVGVTEDFSPVKQGIRTAAELGAWMVPAGTAAKGIPLTKGVGLLAGKTFGKAVARGTVTGAITGTLFGLSKEEMDDLGEVAQSAATGAVFGGVTAGIAEGIKRAWRALTQKAPIKMRVAQLRPSQAQLKKMGFKNEAEFRKFAEMTLKGDVPANYEKMVSYADEVEKAARSKLSKIGVSGNFAVDDVFQTKLEQGFAVDTLGSVVNDLNKKGRFTDAKQVVKVLNVFQDVMPVTPTGKVLPQTVDINDLLFVKRQLDMSAVSTFGKATSAIDNQKKAALRFVADRIRDTVRNSPQSSSMVKGLLDVERNAIRLKGLAETAAGKVARRPGPSWFAISSILIPSMVWGPSGAVPGLAGLGIYAGARSPVVAKGLYQAGQVGQKVGEKVPELGLQTWLTKLAGATERSF